MLNEGEALSLETRVYLASDIALTLVRAERLIRQVYADEVAVVSVLTAASELLHNLVCHAGGGSFRVRLVGPPTTLELETRDRGPGIGNVARAVSPNFSTSGTLGLGLPGVQRLMDELSIESAPGRTIVRARKGC